MSGNILAQSCTSSWQEEHPSHWQTEGYEKPSKKRNAKNPAALPPLLHQGSSKLPTLCTQGSPEQTESPWQKCHFAAPCSTESHHQASTPACLMLWLLVPFMGGNTGSPVLSFRNNLHSPLAKQSAHSPFSLSIFLCTFIGQQKALV